MKIKTITAIIGSLFASTAFANSAEQEYFKSVYQDAYQQVSSKLETLRQQANNPNNVIVENNQRYLEVNGIKYRLNSDNYILFDFPRPFTDESSFRNIFNSLSDDWELTWYDLGVVMVNKHFGNYEYGNGCLMEYYPGGTTFDNEFTRVALETSSCSLNDFSTQLEYFEHDKTITAQDLGVESLSITAVERYKDRLYVTQDTTPGTVFIIDVNTKAVLGTITGIETPTGFADYKRINELYIRDNLLYVASLSSNRVDIFDLDNNHQHVTTIGTGSWSGSNGILHAQSVVANNEYVIVSDASNRISVYRQSEVTPENNLKMSRYGFLNFEGKYTHRKVQMHILDHYLLVLTANKNYYIYDLNKIDDAVASGTYLDPEMRVDQRIQKIDKEGDKLIVNFADRIEWHSVNDVIAANFSFDKPLRTIKSLNGYSITALNDLHFSHGELVTASAKGLSIDNLKVNDVAFVADQSVETKNIHFDALMPSSVTEILTNDEPHSVLINRELRSVNINSLVKTQLLDNETVQITNYAAKELKDIAVELKLNGINKWFVLGQFDRLPAYAQITLPLSAFGEQFNSVDGDGYFDLAPLFASSMNITKAFEARFDSKTDTFAQTLARLKPSWEIRFAANSEGKWRAMNGLYAREWLIIMTNFAYMVSSNEFKHVWFNFKDIMGYDMHGTAGAVNEPNGFFTAQDYDHYYHSLLKRPYVNVGITAMGGGLGSQGITGVDTWMFYTHYYGTWGIIAHEFGHGFDGMTTYGHHTSFANGGNGWQPLMTMLANYHIRKGDLPYMDDNINGFYKEENNAYHYSGIDLNKRKYRADTHMYLLDNYFMTFSSMPKGWVENGPEFNLATVNGLNNQERMLMAKYPMGDQSLYLCRFTFSDGEQYFGYVDQADNQNFCNAGSDISYRQANGEQVALRSQVNAFEWLSLYNPSLKDQAVTNAEGQSLCQMNYQEFYGTGFVNGSGQCVQKPNVYWSNGNRWVFSSRWSEMKFR
ncbi:TPA: YncE family protein [Photobacterium damselae]